MQANKQKDCACFAQRGVFDGARAARDLAGHSHIRRGGGAAACLVVDRLAERHVGHAQWLEARMRKRAGLRLKRLKAAHADGHYHDGAAMYNALEALRGTTGKHEETLDHDREVEKMRDEFLPDGCAVSEYTDKIERLVRDHT